MYQELVGLIRDMVFGGTLENTTYGVLICEGVAAIATLLLLAFPFIIVWRVLRRFL